MTPTDLDGLVERLLLRTLTASDQEATAAAIIRLREERDSARSEASHVAKMFMRQRDVLLEVRGKLRAVVQELDNYAWDRYMRAVKWPDYIEASRKAHARAEAAEAALAKAREALGILLKAKDLKDRVGHGNFTEFRELKLEGWSRARAIMEEGRE